MKLVATKSFTYSTRHLQAGDVFESKTNRDAKLLVGIRKARLIEDRPEKKIPEPNKELIEKLAEKEITLVEKIEAEAEVISENEEVSPVEAPEVIEVLEENSKEESSEISEDEDKTSKKRNYIKRK